MNLCFCRRNLRAALDGILCCLPLLTGCHSAFIQATVENHMAGPVHLFEVDYPSASFGGGELAPGAAFHYRFKVLGDGALKLTWTDNSGDHAATGPEVHEGEEGTVHITLSGNTATWQATVTAKH